MANFTAWAFLCFAAIAGLLILVSASILVAVKNTIATVADTTMGTTTATITETLTDEFGFYVFPTDQLPPKFGEPGYTYAAYDDANSYTFHDLMYDGTNKDKIIRGFLVGSVLGLVLAMCCCCWFPCFRDGFMGDIDQERPQPTANRRARRAAASNNTRQPSEGPDGIELVNMSGALPATQQGGTAGRVLASRAISRVRRNRRRND